MATKIQDGMLLNNTTCIDGSVASAFTCPVCLAFYKNPVMLSQCGHTLCLDCAGQMKANSEGKVTCPECRVESEISEHAPPNISVKKVVETLATDESAIPVGVTCPHIGLFTQEKQVCPHCENAFCSVCVVIHLERLKIDMKWLQSSFKARAEKAIEDLDIKAFKAKKVIKEQVAQARIQVEHETEEIVDWIRRRKDQWLLSLEKLERDQKRLVDVTVQDFKTIPFENDLMEGKVAETVGTSILFSSADVIAKLNNSLVSLDQKIFNLEEFEKTATNFTCIVDFEELKSTCRHMEPKVECSNESGASCDSQTTEHLRLRRAVENDQMEEYFDEHARVSPTVASFAVNGEDGNGQTALFVVAKKGNAEMARYLVEKCGANIFHKDATCHGDLPVHVAARHDNVQVLKYCVESDTINLNILNSEKYTPLLVAAESGSLEVLKFLLELHKVDIEHRTLDGYTPLMLAVKRNDIEMVRYLIEIANCDARVRKPVTKDNILHIAAKNRCGDVLEYLAMKFPFLLLETNCANGINLCLLPIGETIVSNYLDGFKILAETDKAWFYENVNEKLMLPIAAMYGSTEIGRYLIEMPQVEAFYFWKTNAAIHIAVTNNHVKFVELLLKARPELVNLQNANSPPETPLDIAQRCGFLEIENMLLATLRKC